uniref:Large ribosomal subunit protein uL11m n=1 Tax=Ascaris lumbricoides TaxID=6252 RepID=A0A9J2PKE0_ASCLU
MASKAGARVRKKEVVKVIHGALLKTNIRAQMATAAPPLGPQLGQRGLNVANFCKEFNKETGHIKPGALLPTRVYIKPDRTYDLEICTPTTSWLLKRAAGIRRGRQIPGEIAGRLSVKHIYEIAKVKSRDKCLVGVPLQDICRMIIKSCRTMGIEVVREDLNPDEYRAFLEKRKEIVDGQLKELAEKKAAKMLRTT